MQVEETENPFRLTDILKLAPHPELNQILVNLAEKLLRLEPLEKVYRDCSGTRGHYQFLHGLLKRLNIRYQIQRENFESTCRKGPAIVVANHPYGWIDAILSRRRMS